MMKKLKNKPLLCLLGALLAALITLTALFAGGGAERVYAYGAYDFEFTDFYVTYDLRADRTMDVTLDLGIRYLGYASTGVMHDIPVNAGDRVRHIEAYELDAIGGAERSVDYSVYSEYSDLITVDIGDYSTKTGETHYYRVKYEYAITKPTEKNTIFLNAVGYGSQAEINNVNVTVNLPDGFKGAYASYTGAYGEEVNKTLTPDNGALSLNFESLRSYHGLTLTMEFDEGVLSTKADLTPYWIIIVACAIIAVLVIFKFLVFNKSQLTPITNTDAPDDMDPLVMGKLIDNKVDKSDVTSLIYYWANKGFLKIDLSDQNDVALIRTVMNLPMNAPAYQKKMFAKLFEGGDLVKINSLSQKFYPTVEAVTKEVNAENGKLYDGKSMAAAVLFALVGALVMGVTPIVLTMTTIARSMFTVIPLFMVIPAFVAFALAQTVRYNTLKHKKSKLALMYVGIIALCAVFTAIYCIVVPSYQMELTAKILICVVGFAIVILSTTLISRTEAYTEKLNKIIGFRDFILYAEKDRLETMLEGNPEFYYQVLPYAIVLGISDIWENKFSALTIQPPEWSTGSAFDRLFTLAIFNSVLRNASLSMTRSFISHPSSGSYSGGGFRGGGGFGGFSGGGHGGGGFRGR